MAVASFLPWPRSRVLRFATTSSILRSHLRRGLSNVSGTAAAAPASVMLPDHADVVVVGGGIIGTSIAFHLAHVFGMENVVLLERDRLTSGTTWHAAGLMNSFGSLSATSTWMRTYTQHLYRDVLPELTCGLLSAGYQEIGFIELACDTDRLDYYRRIAAYNRHLGVMVHEIGPDEVQDRFPLCRIDDVQAGFYVPADGRANPTDATLALAKAARLAGAALYEQSPVARVLTTTCRNDIHGRRSVAGVEMENGHIITTPKVVNCTGMWARQFAAHGAGVHCLPNQAAEHYYIITEPINGIQNDWPVIEDSSKCCYIRPEGGGLMIGLFEWDGAPWKVDAPGIPNDFSFGSLPPDYDRIIPYVANALERVPAAQNVGIKSFFCGPESFTPDGQPMVGESRELRHYYVGAGLNSLGILTGGGLGHILASWVKHGHAPDDIDVTAINANRFHPHQSNATYRQHRTGEILGETYKVHFPDHLLQTCRNVQQSPLHDRLVRIGAQFKDVSGWEAPLWYGPPPDALPPNGVVQRETFGRPDWFDNWANEHAACRNHVALFDMSFMSKFLVQGRDAGPFLNRLSTANVVDGAPAAAATTTLPPDQHSPSQNDDNNSNNRITYTQWLNERGYMEADLTVMKLDWDKFLVVATDTMRQNVMHHMTRHLESSEFVTIVDVTGAYAMISLQGPQSRALLQELTAEDMSQFSFRQAKSIDICLARAICARITYVGELGYELYVPVEQARYVYDQIAAVVAATGDQYQLQHAGLKALGSLRLEKGYRDYGHDMDNTDTLLECGLGFTCDWHKSRPFIGQDRGAAKKERARAAGGLHKRLVSVLVPDPNTMLHHGEVLWHTTGSSNTSVADVRAGSYGHSLGGAVGLAMLQCDQPITEKYLQNEQWQVEIGQQRHSCKLSLSPFFDPKNLRIKV
jgi:glycine cleavage system aminomethyltransferase T/glycine/D-amino acid oxidase-like deaminating enzyme